MAEDTIADVDASGLWPGKVVTELSEAGPFWEAEAEDQDYLQRYPNGYTCHFPRPNWKLPHRVGIDLPMLSAPSRSWARACGLEVPGVGCTITRPREPQSHPGADHPGT